MYHLTRLVVDNTNPEQMREILTQILKIENPRKYRTLATLDLEGHELFDYDEEFDEDLHECIEPSLMNLPKGARAYTYYTEE